MWIESVKQYVLLRCSDRKVYLIPFIQKVMKTMINRAEIAEAVKNNYITLIHEKNPEISDGKIKYILDVYTHLTINETDLDDQKFAVSFLNLKNETGHSIKIGNLFIDLKKALSDIFQMVVKAKDIKVEEGLSFTNCALLIDIFTAAMKILDHKFTKEEFHILYCLYLKNEANQKGVEEKDLESYICEKQGGDKLRYETALRFLEKTKMISLVNGRYILMEKVVIQCYI